MANRTARGPRGGAERGEGDGRQCDTSLPPRVRIREQMSPPTTSPVSAVGSGVGGGGWGCTVGVGWSARRLAFFSPEQGPTRADVKWARYLLLGDERCLEVLHLLVLPLLQDVQLGQQGGPLLLQTLLETGANTVRLLRLAPGLLWHRGCPVSGTGRVALSVLFKAPTPPHKRMQL